MTRKALSILMWINGSPTWLSIRYRQVTSFFLLTVPIKPSNYHNKCLESLKHNIAIFYCGRFIEFNSSQNAIDRMKLSSGRTKDSKRRTSSKKFSAFLLLLLLLFSVRCFFLIAFGYNQNEIAESEIMKWKQHTR